MICPNEIPHVLGLIFCETFFFFFYASIIGLSLYRCKVPYRTVRYKVTNMSRDWFSMGDKGQSFLLSQTHVLSRTVRYSICQVDFPYGTVQYMVYFMGLAVVFHYYIWNDQAFYYGTEHYIIVLYGTVL